MKIRMALLMAAGLLPAAPRALEESPIFQVEVHVRRADEGAGVLPAEGTRSDLAGAGVTLHEEISLDLSFRAGASLRPIRDTGASSYAWKRSVLHTRDSQTVREESGAEAGAKLLDWDAVIERTYRPVACEELVVHDRVEEGRSVRSVEADKDASTVRLHLTASWPGKVRLRDAAAGVAPFVEESLPTLELDRSFPYELRYADARRLVSFASTTPASESLPAAERRWSVTFSVAPLTPFGFGLDARTGLDGAPVLANRVVAGGRDVSRGLAVRRMLRWWRVHEAGGGSTAYERQSDWRVFTDEANRPIPPEILQEPAGTSSGSTARWLVEFLEMVDGLPELGLLYHTVSIESRAEEPRYRLSASEARSISGEAWCDIRHRSSPGMASPEVAARGPLSVLLEKTYASSGLATR